MKLIHLYTGPDGRSHFRDLALAVTEDRGGLLFELGDAVQGAEIRDLPAGWTNDFHTAPRRQLVLQLLGSGEINCGDGTSRIVGPGDLLLADDVTGEGHWSREIEGPRRQLIIAIDESLDVDSWARG